MSCRLHLVDNGDMRSYCEQGRAQAGECGSRLLALLTSYDR